MRIIAGPCQHESLEQSLEIAKECKFICDWHGWDYVFKASFDKANRTNINGARGVGLHQTIADFLAMKEEIPDLKILTDVHEKEHLIWLKGIVDVIQIPAFLCRQTDLIQAACDTGHIVNIKKGQFMAPWDVKGILSKTEGAKEVWITERGTSFGYNNLVVDYTGIMYMLDNYSVPIVFDVTHSVQKPSVLGECSGGNRDYVPGLARAAAALGVTNFFLEVHADPDNAPSDGPNMIQLNKFQEVIDGIDRFSYSS